MFKSIWTFFVLFSLLLMQISCQSIQNKQTNETSNSKQSSDAKDSKSDIASKKLIPSTNLNPLPDYKLTDKILYSYMLGELAKQNNDYSQSYDSFYALALKTRDRRIAKSALLVALETNNDLYIYNDIFFLQYFQINFFFFTNSLYFCFIFSTKSWCTSLTFPNRGCIPWNQPISLT